MCRPLPTGNLLLVHDLGVAMMRIPTLFLFRARRPAHRHTFAPSQLTLIPHPLDCGRRTAAHYHQLQCLCRGFLQVRDEVSSVFLLFQPREHHLGACMVLTHVSSRSGSGTFSPTQVKTAATGSDRCTARPADQLLGKYTHLGCTSWGSIGTQITSPLPNELLPPCLRRNMRSPPHCPKRARRCPRGWDPAAQKFFTPAVLTAPCLCMFSAATRQPSACPSRALLLVSAPAVSASVLQHANDSAICPL